MPSHKKKKEEKAEQNHMDLSEEEIEEERQDEAARYIQSAYRAKMARDLLKLMIRQNFVKLKDRNTGIYFYKNRTSGETMMRKPRILGNDDLPTPRDFKSPEDYDAGFSDMDAFAMIITVNTFTNDRIANIGPQSEADHSTFEHLLGHDYICKFRGENIISLRNPSVLACKDAFGRLRKMAKKRGFVFIYICTHVVTIETKVVKDDCFFCFKDTVWKNSDMAAQSSISLSEICHLINVLGVDRKVIAVNFAHAKATPKSFFKSRYFYPPPDTLMRMADMCNCAVLGSCNVGSSIPDMQEHTPTSQLTSQRRGAIKIVAAAAGTSLENSARQVALLPPVAPSKSKDGDMEAATSDQRMGEDIQHVAMMAHREMAADIVAQYQREWMEGSKGESVGASMQKPKQPGLKWRKAVTGEEEKPPPGQSGDKGSAEGKAAGSKDEEKKVGKKKAAVNSLKKKKRKAERKDQDDKKADEKVAVDLAKSLEDKETEAANELGIQIALPSTKENMKFRWSIAMWNVKKVVFPPIRYVKSKYAKHRLKTGNAPMQHSAVLDRYTLFGKVMCDGLTGNIKPILKNNFVSALDLFFYMRDKMRKGIAEWLERVDGPDGQKLLHSQDPVLFVPVDNPQAADYPVCCVCGPPAAPDIPFVIKCGTNSALLEWSNPPFDGIPPTHYKLYLRNNCRLCYNWTVVTGAELLEHVGPVSQAQRFNINHLPAGVEVEFCVAAHNNGGWGMLSRGSVGVIPGAFLQPQSLRAEWKKITKGGPLAVLDRLDFCKENRLEHVLGMKLLITFAQKEGVGFSRINIREKVALMAMRALKTFPLDNEICAPAFNLIGYCIHGHMHKKLKMTIIKDGLIDQLEKCMAHYRSDSRVMNAVNWLRRVLPYDVPKNGGIALIPFGVEKKEEDELEQ